MAKTIFHLRSAFSFLIKTLRTLNRQSDYNFCNHGNQVILNKSVISLVLNVLTVNQTSLAVLSIKTDCLMLRNYTVVSLAACTKI